MVEVDGDGQWRQSTVDGDGRWQRSTVDGGSQLSMATVDNRMVGDQPRVAMLTTVRARAMRQ